MLGLIRSVITQRGSLYPIFFYIYYLFSPLRCFHFFRFNSNISFVLFGYSLLFFVLSFLICKYIVWMMQGIWVIVTASPVLVVNSKTAGLNDSFGYVQRLYLLLPLAFFLLYISPSRLYPTSTLPFFLILFQNIGISWSATLDVWLCI